MKTLLALTLGTLLLVSHAHGLILVKQRDEPVSNLGWPKGAEEVANPSPTRY